MTDNSEGIELFENFSRVEIIFAILRPKKISVTTN